MTLTPFATRSRTLTASALLLLSLPAAFAQTNTARVVSAANAFLATLTPEQRKAVVFSFDDEKQRVLWSNLPQGIVSRGGISLQQMTPSQRTAAMAVLSAALSRRGYEKVQQIMDADEVLKNNGGANLPPNGQQPNSPPTNAAGGPPPGARGPGGPGGRGGGGGRNLTFGRDFYFVSFLGNPSEKSPWMLQFGGHHLAVNVTMDGVHGILTPTLTGAQPAMYTLNGKTVRPLGGESDKALALLQSLDDNERKQAVLGFKLADLVLGPGQDGVTIQPEGLKASAMTDKQRAMLLDVISEWANITDDASAAARMAQLKADIPQTWFAWSGPTNGTVGKNIAAYYRIQGPHLVIEYAPQEMGGDATLHLHTMYRDPTNDYARAPAKK